jgi:prepilin-type N-terminal cleavage/methylation domain-containing protein
MRRGLTLVELLIASAIMAMTVAALAGVAKAVRLGAAHGDGQAQAVQHARVALDRIARMAREATASPVFPGFLVVAETEGGWRFPDTLVVWHPNGTAVNPDGLPRFDELTIYCPHPDHPEQLVEITAPSDTRTAPSVDDATTWASEISAIKRSSSSQVVTLTNLLRVCAVGASQRGAARFETRLRPTAAQWTSYKAGTLAWGDMPWVQGICGSQTGLRQSWVRIELQLMPGATAAAQDPQGQQAIPFFDSAAIYYEMHR